MYLCSELPDLRVILHNVDWDQDEGVRLAVQNAITHALMERGITGHFEAYYHQMDAVPPASCHICDMITEEQLPEAASGPESASNHSQSDDGDDHVTSTIDLACAPPSPPRPLRPNIQWHQNLATIPEAEHDQYPASMMFAALEVIGTPVEEFLPGDDPIYLGYLPEHIPHHFSMLLDAQRDTVIATWEYRNPHVWRLINVTAC